MTESFKRLGSLIGEEKLAKLAAMKVVIFGIGGVGGYTAESLARCGVGKMILVDGDTVEESNINRQIAADTAVIGRYKADVMRERILRINPAAEVTAVKEFFRPGDPLDFAAGCAYAVDATDAVSAKIELAVRLREAGIPLISAMGAGNKLDPTAFKAADIFDTSVCPLCRIMRTELRKRNVPALRVVYSEEKPLTPCGAGEREHSGRPAPGSFQPAVAACGTLIAYEVVKDTIL